MKKKFVTLCSIAMLTSLSSSAFAQKDFSPHHKMTPEMKAKMEQRKEEFEKRLNLTPEQKEKMRAMHEASKEKIRPLFEQMRLEKDKLNQLRTSNASAQDIKLQEEKVFKLKSELRNIRKADFEKTQSILNPEQQKEFNKMHEEHKKEWKQRKGKNFNK
jgi:Spy/CpxP family protein refolding chaperone